MSKSGRRSAWAGAGYSVRKARCFPLKGKSSVARTELSDFRLEGGRKGGKGNRRGGGYGGNAEWPSLSPVLSERRIRLAWRSQATCVCVCEAGQNPGCPPWSPRFGGGAGLTENLSSLYIRHSMPPKLGSFGAKRR